MRAHRQDTAPDRPCRPGGRLLSTAAEPATDHPSAPPPAARKICCGDRGQIHQLYREGQDQLAALGLVLNAVVLWNTRYLDVIVE